MTYRPSLIEQQIAWTRFRRQTDKDVLRALARWFCWRADGSNVRPSSIDALAAKSGVPKRSAERALARLEAAGFLRVTATEHRHPSTYQIIRERLATTDPEGVTIVVDNTRAVDRQSGGQSPGLTATMADRNAFDRQSGGQEESGGQENRRDFEKVADPYGSEEGGGEEICPPPPDRDRVRQSGGQTEVFAAWWTMNYPTYNHGTQNPIDAARDGARIQKLLDVYPDDLQAMALLMWQVVPDRNPKSDRSWIARETDRGLGVLERKAKFLSLSLTAPEQLTFGPMEAIVLSAKEIEEAKTIRSRVYGGRCPHDPECADWKACVREIAVSRHIA